MQRDLTRQEANRKQPATGYKQEGWGTGAAKTAVQARAQYFSSEAIPIRLVLAIILLCTACGSSDAAPDASPDDGRTALTVRTIEGETADLRVVIADTAEERETGLSNRDSLGADEGMLFISEERLGFWMKDTRIPLSAAFIGECGKIVHIAEMQPLSLEIHNTTEDYAYGLEVNAGWFAAHGIEVGDEVELPSDITPAGCV